MLTAGIVRRWSGRSPHGERGLKYDILCLSAVNPGRSPHGERGLKLKGIEMNEENEQVALLMESVD